MHVTYAQYVEHETVLGRLVRQLVGHAVEADVSVQVEGADGGGGGGRGRGERLVVVQLRDTKVKNTTIRHGGTRPERTFGLLARAAMVRRTSSVVARTGRDLGPGCFW